MNDKFIDDLLDDTIPSADTNARKVAINLAVSAFAHETAQGNTALTRPIDNGDTSSSKHNQSIGDFLVKVFSNLQTKPVFATVAVAFIAGSLVTFMPHKPDAVSTLEAPNILGDVRLDETTITPSKKTEAFSSADTNSAITSVIQPKQDAEQAPDESTDSAAPQTEAAASRQAPVATARAQASLNRDAKVLNEKKAYALQSYGANTKEKRIVEDLDGVIEPQRPDLGEEYLAHEENLVRLVSEEPVSTFSVDVDSASYSLVRSQLLRGYLPSPAAVRTEEFINYFDYNYPLPESKNRPFEASINVFDSPWNTDKKLVHIGIKGYDIAKTEQPDSNLVFLLDVSGSMGQPNKLPLVKQSINLLLDTLKPTDTVSIVVYAGAAGTVLEPTKVSEKSKIFDALRRLDAGGSTAGGQGIELAYQLAELNFNKAAVNRIVLATDGDFNVGQQSNEALKTLVERKREQGVFLSVLGFGRNNYQDDMMQTLAQNGNGVAAYIDSLSEAKKVLVDQATSTLFTIAKDVKLQVEFNPATVSEYRLVGYETRALNREDFNNDKIDAGDIGAGHSVTAIYEITPIDAESASIDKPRYSANKSPASKENIGEYGFLKIRFKLPNESTSSLIEKPIGITESTPSPDVLFSTAVAGFAQLLKGGKNTGSLSYDDIITRAQANKGEDKFGYRGEFIRLVNMAKIAKP